jgi:hypothetical protein
MALLQRPCVVQTLVLGGGPPTHLSPGQLERLLDTVLRWLPLAPGGEFSIEANPDSLDADKVAVLADHGVNRVSLGVQSFQPHLLRTLERSHDDLGLLADDGACVALTPQGKFVADANHRALALMSSLEGTSAAHCTHRLRVVRSRIGKQPLHGQQDLLSRPFAGIFQWTTPPHRQLHCYGARHANE